MGRYRTTRWWYFVWWRNGQTASCWAPQSDESKFDRRDSDLTNRWMNFSALLWMVRKRSRQGAGDYESSAEEKSTSQFRWLWRNLWHWELNGLNGYLVATDEEHFLSSQCKRWKVYGLREKYSRSSNRMDGPSLNIQQGRLVPWMPNISSAGKCRLADWGYHQQRRRPA